MPTHVKKIRQMPHVGTCGIFLTFYWPRVIAHAIRHIRHRRKSHLTCFSQSKKKRWPHLYRLFHRSDPLPTWLLMECLAELTPCICRLFNASLRAGRVPQSFKSAYVTPLLKKAGLDNSDRKNYRPISNLSVMSKLLERVILHRLLENQVQRPATQCAVCLPEIPLHRSCARKGIIGYLDGTWPRQRGGTGRTGPVRRVWHSRSSYSALSPPRVMWHWWHGAE